MLRGNFEVIEVSEILVSRRTPGWQVVMNKPDGSRHGHVFPKMAMAARSIEYGIDVEDEELLWDIVIHEPYMLREGVDGDPVMAAGLVVPDLIGNPVPISCYSADSLQEAKAAHLIRLEHCKSELVTVRDKKIRRRPIVKHREDDWTQAHIEDVFRAVRKSERALVAEARRAAANR